MLFVLSILLGAFLTLRSQSLRSCSYLFISTAFSKIAGRYGPLLEDVEPHATNKKTPNMDIALDDIFITSTIIKMILVYPPLHTIFRLSVYF